MPATAATKQAAKTFVYLLRAGGRTAAYDALEAAFRFDTEAIYFLSDGEPNAGKVPRPNAILKAVHQINRTRRVSIYTIGIAPGNAGGPLDSFTHPGVSVAEGRDQETDSERTTTGSAEELCETPPPPPHIPRTGAA